ncbi:MAG TPA: hypothetical protein VN841_25295 [Bryobacteraceae bacterium]|nr:hypothetical protein [Bryobacteraceae bacterium]
MKAVKTIPIPVSKPRKPKEDPHYAAAVERAKETARRLVEAGIIDARGRRIRKDVPADMRHGSDHDFGG